MSMLILMRAIVETRNPVRRTGPTVAEALRHTASTLDAVRMVDDGVPRPWSSGGIGA
ncbi:hypothetical protein [Actinosynnema sp. ALI-1.44]|uniref:hypothetical protein n=1 Tax=Actinosynnema sp. ALI-1.44 TaxID=1933779 RepID=UPI00143DCD0A|nr:hypothetical protein [Actinosynnema sp. ALI-1.44]